MNRGRAYTKQHVVPQSYLQRFAEKNTNNKGYHIGVRLKNKGNINLFTKAIEDIAYVDNYYDVSTREDPKYWEHYFSKHIEPLYGQPLSKIISKITLSASGEKILDYNDKYVLALMICFQILRVPAFIDRQLEKGKNICDEIIAHIFKTYEDYLSDEQVAAINRINIDRNFLMDNTLINITDDRRLEKWAKILTNKVWVVYYNNSVIPFFTSDNPVLLYNIETHSIDYEDNGIGRNDSIISFPITGKILVQLFSPALFLNSADGIDSKRIVLKNKDLKFITGINVLQLEHSSYQSFMHPQFLHEIEND